MKILNKIWPWSEFRWLKMLADKNYRDSLECLDHELERNRLEKENIRLREENEKLKQELHDSEFIRMTNSEECREILIENECLKQELEEWQEVDRRRREEIDIPPTYEQCKNDYLRRRILFRRFD